MIKSLRVVESFWSRLPTARSLRGGIHDDAVALALGEVARHKLEEELMQITRSMRHSESCHCRLARGRVLPACPAEQEGRR